MDLPYIINIQKFSVHDGDGIRTTIFFKGCNLNCWWCHNPESQSYRPEFMFDKEKCTGCGYCVKACDKKAITISDNHKAITNKDKCVLCEECFDYCLQNAREIAGRIYEIDELVNICEKDKVFYEESGGGVTLSGGEAMTQSIDFLEKLCIELKKKGINIAIDTCGYAPPKNFERIMPYADTFLYDIKTLDDNTHIKYTGKSNKLVLSNLEFIASHGADINIRIPVIDNVNSDDKSIKDIVLYVKENVGIVSVNLLPYHSTGSSKYDKLNRIYPSNEFKVPSNDKMEHIKNIFIENGFVNVKIGG